MYSCSIRACEYSCWTVQWKHAAAASSDHLAAAAFTAATVYFVRVRNNRSLNKSWIYYARRYTILLIYTNLIGASLIFFVNAFRLLTFAFDLHFSFFFSGRLFNEYFWFRTLIFVRGNYCFPSNTLNFTVNLNLAHVYNEFSFVINSAKRHFVTWAV